MQCGAGPSNRISRREFLRLGVAAAALGTLGLANSLSAAADAQPSPNKPNIVFIMADDLGYGSVGCYGATKVKTPHIDSIAREGVLFTDAHSPYAVCTPSRYSVLTGRYYFRPNPKARKWTASRPLLIGKDQMTVASLLKSKGYATGAVGKWHLGFGETEPDYNSDLKPGPLEIGFDYYFGCPNSHCEAPYVFVENHKVVGLDPKDPIVIDKKTYRSMTGGKAARFVQEEVGITQAAKAVEFIEKHKDKPFFLYFVPDNIHDPITPNARFKGTSGIGAYGDYIHELDWQVGEILNTLDRLKLTDNTLVMFTSDNGAICSRSYASLKCNGDLLGQKTDVWEGGHRVPFVAKWPGVVKRGTRSDAVIMGNDLLATAAEIVGHSLKEGEGPDSISMVSAFKGASAKEHARQEAVFGGSFGFAVRQGDWLLIPKQGSCGLTTKEAEKSWWLDFKELGAKNSDYDENGKLKPDAPPGQLYNLRVDSNQTTNLYSQHPDIVKRLTALLIRTRAASKSRP